MTTRKISLAVAASLGHKLRDVSCSRGTSHKSRLGAAQHNSWRHRQVVWKIDPEKAATDGRRDGEQYWWITRVGAPGAARDSFWSRARYDILSIGR